MSDREGDIYPMFARRPETIDFVVRAAHDRVLTEGKSLHAVAATWPVLGSADVKVASKRPGDKGRTATVNLKAGTVTIMRPQNNPDRLDPCSLKLGLVEVREDAVTAAGGQSLLWRLVTTLPVATLADAREAVRLYRLRWRIEEVFRVLKSNGLDIEESQLETADRLLNLAALGLVAVARIIQLVDGSTRPATDVIAAENVAAAAALSTSFEDDSARQKNPHATGSLAWLSWITARLGGWNCYYKPPGPKNHGARPRPLDRPHRRVQTRNRKIRCVNPVGRRPGSCSPTPTARPISPRRVSCWWYRRR